MSQPTQERPIPTGDQEKALAPALGWPGGSIADGVLSKLPKDAFMGAGAGNQVLIVVPSLDLIVVRFGSQMEKDSFWGGIENCLVNPLMDAIMKIKTKRGLL